MPKGSCPSLVFVWSFYVFPFLSPSGDWGIPCTKLGSPGSTPMNAPLLDWISSVQPSAFCPKMGIPRKIPTNSLANALSQDCLLESAKNCQYPKGRSIKKTPLEGRRAIKKNAFPLTGGRLNDKFHFKPMPTEYKKATTL